MKRKRVLYGWYRPDWIRHLEMLKGKELRDFPSMYCKKEKGYKKIQITIQEVP